MPLSPRLLRPAAALCVAAVLPLAGCGDSGGGDPSADPAAMAPARAPVYVEANLKPGDDVKELAKKLSGEEDPGGAIKRWIEKEVRDTDPDFKYSEDVEPWLGDRAGVFVSGFSLSGDSPPFAVVVATKDVDKARDVLEPELREGGSDEPKPQVVERSHEGTDYLVDTSDDEALAFVDDYAIFGTDAAVKLSIEAKDGESLAENDEYGNARDEVEQDGVGFAYLRLSQIFGSLGPQGAAFREALSGYGDTFAVGLDADVDSIDLESVALGVSEESAGAGPGEVLTQLPGSSWAALGAADFGKQIQRAIEQFAALGAQASGQSPEELFDQLEQQLGFDIRRELSWIGDIGIFVMGDRLPELGGGLVAEAKDAAAARRSVGRLASLLEKTGDVNVRPLRRSGVAEGVTVTSPELPVPIHIAVTDDDRFIIAVTDGALAQTIRPTDALGESAAWREASERLGEGFTTSFFVNFEPIPGLLEASGVADDNETAKDVIEALKKLTTLSAGGKREGDVARGRLVIGVK